MYLCILFIYLFIYLLILILILIGIKSGAVLQQQEVCVRVLLDRGADVNVIQGGLNTPFLLACSIADDSIARLLIERGAVIRLRNHQDEDAVFLAVVYVIVLGVGGFGSVADFGVLGVGVGVGGGGGGGVCVVVCCCCYCYF